MPIIGKILWWDQRDGNGVIVDARNKEYYFDTSVLKSRSSKTLRSGLAVWFEINRAIKSCLCAHNVVLPAYRDRKVAEREFEKRNAELSP